MTRPFSKTAVLSTYLLTLLACDTDATSAGLDADGAAADASDAGSDAGVSGAALRDGGGDASSALVDAGRDAANPTSHDGPCRPPVGIDQPAMTLRETGCMDAQHPTQLAAALIPYEVNSPLWSDGADKQRGLMLPQGGKIHVKDCARQPSECNGAYDTGRWVLPVGTVLVKSFDFDGKLVETRLFVRFDAETWVGYSYQWNEQQTQATIVPDERRSVEFDTGKRKVEWNYPSRLDCMKCHNQAGGSSLGPETAQLNRLVDGKNQLDRFSELGVFDAALTTPYAAALVTPYTSQAGMPPSAASIESRTRAYLHANCGFCHRPDADFPSLDLRFGVPLADMGVCGTEPAKGDVGVPGATNLTPGKPMQSVMWLRVHAQPEEGRMPQIGTYVIDDAAVQLLGDWISGISGCP